MKTYIKDLLWYVKHQRTIKGWIQFKHDIDLDKKEGLIHER